MTKKLLALVLALMLVLSVPVSAWANGLSAFYLQRLPQAVEMWAEQFDAQVARLRSSVGLDDWVKIGKISVSDTQYKRTIEHYEEGSPLAVLIYGNNIGCQRITSEKATFTLTIAWSLLGKEKWYISFKENTESKVLRQMNILMAIQALSLAEIIPAVSEENMRQLILLLYDCDEPLMIEIGEVVLYAHGRSFEGNMGNFEIFNLNYFNSDATCQFEKEHYDYFAITL